MNRNIFALIIGSNIILLILSFKFYIDQKNNFFSEYTHYTKLKQLISNINSIKIDKNLNFFKRYKCKIDKQIECNLSKNEFASFENIFRKNYDIKSFSIIKDKNRVIVKLEISR